MMNHFCFHQLNRQLVKVNFANENAAVQSAVRN